MKPRKDADRPRSPNERLRQPHSDIPRQRADDIIERLFGKTTHLSFVVELGGAKLWHERKRS